MASDKSQLEIEATINPAKAKAGAAETVGAINQVKQATGEAAEEQGALGTAAENAVEKLTSLRNAGHVLRGVNEIARGGKAAMAGLSAEVRFLGETLGFLAPEFLPVIVAISTITQLWATMSERMDEHAEKAEERGRKEADGLKPYEDALKGILDAQAKIEANDKKQADAEKAKADAAGQRIKLLTDLEREEAHAQYLRDFAAAKSDEERKKAKDDYELRKADIEGKEDVDLANKSVADKDAEIARAKRSLEITTTNRSANSKELGEKQDAATAGENELFNQGISPDENGSYAKGVGEKKKEFEDAFKKLQAARRYAYQLKSQGNNRAAIRAGRIASELEAPYEKAKEEYGKVLQAVADIDQYKAQGDKLRETITSQDQKIEEQQAAIDRMQGELENLKLQATGTFEKSANAKQELALNAQLEADKDKQKKERQARDAELAAQKTAIETKLANPSLTKAQREALEKEQDKNTIAGLKNKESDQTEDNGGKLDPAIKKEIDAQIEQVTKQRGFKRETEAKQQEYNHQEQRLRDMHNPAAMAHWEQMKALLGERATLDQKTAAIIKEINSTLAESNRISHGTLDGILHAQSITDTRLERLEGNL